MHLYIALDKLLTLFQKLANFAYNSLRLLFIQFLIEVRLHNELEDNPFYLFLGSFVHKLVTELVRLFEELDSVVLLLDYRLFILDCFLKVLELVLIYRLDMAIAVQVWQKVWSNLFVQAKELENILWFQKLKGDLKRNLHFNKPFQWLWSLVFNHDLNLLFHLFSLLNVFDLFLKHIMLDLYQPQFLNLFLQLIVLTFIFLILLLGKVEFLLETTGVFPGHCSGVLH